MSCTGTAWGGAWLYVPSTGGTWCVAGIKLGEAGGTASSKKATAVVALRAWAHTYEGVGRHLSATREQLVELATAGGESEDSDEEVVEGRVLSRGRKARKYLSALSQLSKDVSDADLVSHSKSIQNAVAEKFNSTLDLDAAWSAGKEAIARAGAAITAREAADPKAGKGGVAGTAKPGGKDAKDPKAPKAPTQAQPTQDAWGNWHDSRTKASKANAAAGLPPAAKSARGGVAPVAPRPPAGPRPPPGPPPAAAARPAMVPPPPAAPAVAAAAAGGAGAPRPPPGPPPAAAGPSVCFAFTQRGVCPWGANCRFAVNTPGHP